ncbi:restriction endonuclease subunit S [Bacteroides fragilis]|uniref:restriction endonuclease subunit S n=1 Tax=Bacteroides fragilis TaxID=817 RepID=UPI001D01E912|nr:restriction endonuclease subunit S [Bacteroides fragilis]MCB5658592.1 restriction endonuclease subunit S [Bacteroides fragilis]MCB5700312.1 restriction endonuclease subunit S [Bacteroides fragilis]
MAIDNKDKKVLKSSIEREQNEVACSAECEKIKGSKNLNVPHLRFPEFSGEWKETTLGKIAEITKGSGISKDQLSEQGSPCILYGELYTKYKSEIINEVYSRTELDSSPLVKSKANDVIIPCSGETAIDISTARCVLFNNILLGGDLNIIRLKYDDGGFFAYQLNGARKKDIARVAQGVSVVHLYGENLKQIRVYYPNIEEQRKITHLLSLIDGRIATQNKIIEDLKKLKSAIIEKVFCPPNQKQPVCRIKGFEQPLTTYKMNAFCSRIATKNMDAKCSLVLTIAAQYGLVNQGSFFNKSVASENLTGYYLLHKGEFAYNRSYSAGYDWGTVKRLDNCDEGVLSTLYICFKINETIVDSDFLTYYFESTKWHKGLSDIAGEGARNHGLLNVSMTDYFNTKHRFPSMEEQKVIAKMLNAITEREKKAIVLGECYRKQKQFLLCQMFI